MGEQQGWLLGHVEHLIGYNIKRKPWKPDAAASYDKNFFFFDKTKMRGINFSITIPISHHPISIMYFKKYLNLIESSRKNYTSNSWVKSVLVIQDRKFSGQSILFWNSGTWHMCCRTHVVIVFSSAFPPIHLLITNHLVYHSSFQIK